jgi:hypothetical protein
VGTRSGATTLAGLARAILRLFGARRVGESLESYVEKRHGVGHGGVSVCRYVVDPLASSSVGAVGIGPHGPVREWGKGLSACVAAKWEAWFAWVREG